MSALDVRYWVLDSEQQQIDERFGKGDGEWVAS